MITIRQLRITGIVEAISTLILFFFAMPMKYIYDQPEYVRIFGALHGGLWILFVGLLFYCSPIYKISQRLTVGVFIASIIPFGPFVTDHYLKTYEDVNAKTA